ncbi:MAG TPA: plastocyanin/azurin family copper-binding protein [Candidatus Limnocylindria bacterium]|nr:plastocyanin/azurin family copper-binding protein [Candidatus Limnocylindria bacterium]
MRTHAVLGVLLVLISACGASPSQTTPTAPVTTTAPAAATATAAPTLTASPTPAPAIVEMGDHFFDPAQLTVKVGTTVTWKSVGQSTHDLAARDASFALGSMSFGQTFSFTYTKAGRYPYVCMQHEGDGMVGEVTVVD